MFLIKDGYKWNGTSTCRIPFDRNKMFKQDYSCEYKDVEDNKRLQLRAGDIIKIPDHPYAKYGKKIKGEMAVVLNRYKKIKTTSWRKVYVDYGAEFMMISGEEKGKIKKKLILPSYTKLLWGIKNGNEQCYKFIY